MTSKNIPIFFAVDNNYAPFLSVVIESIKENSSKEYKYQLFILNNDISLEYKNKLNKYNKDNIEINFCSITEKLNSLKEKLPVRDYYSNAIFYRLFIAELYPEFDKALYYSENLDEKMNDKGFCMFVRCGNPEHKRIMERYKDKNPVVIYSMWKGYLEQENIKEFLDGYKKFDMHTSGHADSNAIKMVIDPVKPEVVIPMHTEVPEAFLEIVGDDKVLLPTDNEVVEVKYE